MPVDLEVGSLFHFLAEQAAMATAEYSTTEREWSLVDLLLDQQQTATAVDRFSQFHEQQREPALAPSYRNLIPLAAPEPNEQYAFEVDLDACSGCKSCVTACHSLNGLEAEETWRDVGLLHGGSTEMPVLRHVTAACHHCIEPACLEGCPVNAYDKDPATGIVRHLDDQCIGCQYCILKCPYDVPKYSKSKGIVRKCDMCHDRLAVGEAPACVQACPNQAIRIHTVDKDSIIQASETNQFLPGAPEPSYTLPTTIYKTKQPLPRNVLPADYYSARREHGHLPLVFMLVFTQMSVGAFVVEQGLFSIFAGSGGTLAAVRSMHLVAALLLAFLGMFAAMFHLGRPFYAFRALLGLKTSWLSREILAFQLFAATASAYVATACLPYFGATISLGVENSLGFLAAATGVGGVFCSIMIYVDTRRPFWSGPQTLMKFPLTAIVLGIPTALLISLFGAALNNNLAVTGIMTEYGHRLCLWLLITVAVKLVFENLVFVHLRARRHTPLKRSAMLLSGELSMTLLIRMFFGLVGGILLPALLVFEPALAADGFDPLFVGFLTAIVITLLTVGELLERYLFFVASVAPKMPGAVP